MTTIVLTNKGGIHGIFCDGHTDSKACGIVSCFVESVAAWIDNFDITGKHEIASGSAKITFVGHDDVYDLLCESLTGLAATCPQDVECKVINY